MHVKWVDSQYSIASITNLGGKITIGVSYLEACPPPPQGDVHFGLRALAPNNVRCSECTRAHQADPVLVHSFRMRRNSIVFGKKWVTTCNIESTKRVLRVEGGASAILRGSMNTRDSIAQGRNSDQSRMNIFPRYHALTRHTTFRKGKGQGVEAIVGIVAT